MPLTLAWMPGRFPIRQDSSMGRCDAGGTRLVSFTPDFARMGIRQKRSFLVTGGKAVRRSCPFEYKPDIGQYRKESDGFQNPSKIRVVPWWEEQ